ncbi:hypothetical protein [Thalassotalea fusca]
MHEMFIENVTSEDVPFGVPTLRYEKPTLGQNYWICDNFFPEKIAIDIANRCFNKKKWKLGKHYPYELWLGMRSKNALKQKGWIKLNNG